MDPAELDPIKSALQNQGAAIGRHEQLLHDMMQQLTLLVRAQAKGAQPASIGTGAAAGTSAAAPALASPLPPTDPTPIRGEASVANPERYAGDPETCRGFLLQCSLVFEQQPSRFPTEQCSLVFEQQPSRFPTERSKVAYMTSLLTGRALAWATSLWERASPDTASGESFMRAMRTTFHNPRGGREAAPRLLALSQGTGSVADYAIEFRTLAAESGWNEEALMAVFQQGLNGRLKDELATRELPSTLEALYDVCIRLDTRMRNGRLQGLSPPLSLLFPLRGSLPPSVGVWRRLLGRPSDGNLILGTVPLASYTCLHRCGNRCYDGGMPRRLRAIQG
ncbi:hypothetical protein MHYP_G00303510 [Metynnis hypsauchen]